MECSLSPAAIVPKAVPDDRLQMLQISTHSMCAAAHHSDQRQPELGTAQVDFAQLQTRKCPAPGWHCTQLRGAAAYHKSLGFLCLDVALLHLLLHQLLNGYEVRLAKNCIRIHLITAGAQQGL